MKIADIRGGEFRDAAGGGVSDKDNRLVALAFQSALRPRGFRRHSQIPAGRGQRVRLPLAFRPGRDNAGVGPGVGAGAFIAIRRPGPKRGGGIAPAGFGVAGGGMRAINRGKRLV